MFSFLAVLVPVTTQVGLAQSARPEPDRADAPRFTAIQAGSQELLETLSVEAKDRAALMACAAHRITLLTSIGRTIAGKQMASFLHELYGDQKIVKVQAAPGRRERSMLLEITTEAPADAAIIIDIDLQTGVSSPTKNLPAVCRGEQKIPSGPEKRAEEIETLARDIVLAREEIAHLEAIQKETAELTGRISAAIEEEQKGTDDGELHAELDKKMAELRLFYDLGFRSWSKEEDIDQQVEMISRFPANWIAEHGKPEEGACAAADLTRPRVVSAKPPKYTKKARKEGVEGPVVLQGFLDKRGRLSDIKVLEGLPHGLNEAAIEAVKQWKFEPTRCAGKPIESLYNLKVNFKLSADE